MADLTQNPYTTNPQQPYYQNQTGVQAGDQFQTGSQNTTGTVGQVTGGNQSAQQQNQYGAGQQQLQGQLPGTVSDFLSSGNLPGSFGAPQSELNAYNQAYQEFNAPQAANVYGAGSNVMGLQQTFGLQQFLGNLYNTQSGNFSNALNTGNNIAFNATGQNSSGNYGQQQQQNTNQQQNWQSNNITAGVNNTNTQGY